MYLNEEEKAKIKEMGIYELKRFREFINEILKEKMAVGL